MQIDAKAYSDIVDLLSKQPRAHQVAALAGSVREGTITKEQSRDILFALLFAKEEAC